MSGPISHIVIIVMENRTLNYMFNGFPGAYTVTQGNAHTGRSITLQQLPLEAPGDLAHSYQPFMTAYDNGKMDGFDLEGWDPRLPKFAPYSYAPPTEVQPDWAIAQQYTLADQMFQSNKSNSYPAHQYLIAGQSENAIGNPHAGVWGCDSPPGTTVPILNSFGHEVNGPFPCFDYQTLADLMDGAGLPWRMYVTGVTTHWSAFDAISHIRYGNDWANDVVSPTSQFTTDIANGYLANVTYVMPTDKESDHPGTQSASGPSFVASIVNAVGQSQFWNSSVVLVTWDDWGGLYDPVAPQKLDVMGLGFRVPLLVVSPYAKSGYVSHVQHEFGSILHFAESTFGLPSLGTTDARADDLSDCFNFSQQPRRFVRISAPISPAQLRRIEAADTSPPDD